MTSKQTLEVPLIAALMENQWQHHMCNFSLNPINNTKHNIASNPLSHQYDHGHQKDFFPRGATSGLFQKCF